MAQHFVIVGAGECGARAAMALREEGFDGDVTLVGAETHLPYERPPLSKQGMLAEVFAATTIASAERLAEAGVTFRSGVHISAIDRSTKRLLAADDGACSMTNCCWPPVRRRAGCPTPTASASSICAPSTTRGACATNSCRGGGWPLSAAVSSGWNWPPAREPAGLRSR